MIAKIVGRMPGVDRPGREIFAAPDRRFIALDGKTSRRGHDRAADKAAPGSVENFYNFEPACSATSHKLLKTRDKPMRHDSCVIFDRNFESTADGEHG